MDPTDPPKDHTTDLGCRNPVGHRPDPTPDNTRKVPQSPDFRERKPPPQRVGVRCIPVTIPKGDTARHDSRPYETLGSTSGVDSRP